MPFSPNLTHLDANTVEDATNSAADSKNSDDSVQPQALVLQKKSLWQSIKDVYFEFCSNTSIHGFQYLGQHRPWTEKLFWICIFTVSIYYCTTIIKQIYDKWDATPVIVSFSEKSTPIWNVPFPAVTICPETQRAKNATDPTYFELFQKFVDNDTVLSQFNLTDKDYQDFALLMHFCDDLVTIIPKFSHSPAPLDYFQVINRMSPDFSTHFYQCNWFGRNGDCSDLFTKVYTDGGICYTFNSLRTADLYRPDTVQYEESLKLQTNDTEAEKQPLRWSLEQGYNATYQVDTYPARLINSGAKDGLNMLLQTFDGEMDYSCSGATQGFRLLLHSPDDVPLASKHFVRISMGKQSLIAVKPKMITTSPNVEAYKPHKRQCYLNKERHLRFFKVYSQNNCERECLTNFTYANCGCVKFTMPRSHDMKVCDESQIHCYRSARRTLLHQQFYEGLNTANYTPKDGTKCNCLPSCTTLDYETEISEGNFDLVNVLKAVNSMEEYYEMYPGGKMSQVIIYFKEHQFITSRRSEIYGLTELLANFGGVLGLFMGISILSLIEIIYHFTLRLWSNIRRRIAT